MKFNYLFSFIFFIILFSCIKKTDKSNDYENNYSDLKKDVNLNNVIISNSDTLNIIKNIIYNTKSLSAFPEQKILLNNNGVVISEPVFVNFFLNNRESYLLKNGNKNDLNEEELSINCFSEYNIIQKKDSGIFSIYGKLAFKNYFFLVLKYYDYETSRFYILSFDNDYKLVSSVCFFGYHTFIDIEKNKFKDVIQGNPFINYKINSSQLSTEIIGSDINNVLKWSINEKGIFRLQENNIVESY